MARRVRALAAWAASVFAFALEMRRWARARGLTRAHRVPARVVSIGNLTVGGAGKTTLTLHVAKEAAARGIETAVVCRRYRPGPAGAGDEELLLASALGRSRVHAGASKWRLAAEAAAAGAELIVVDDGFSHWALERDLDVVLIDATDPFGSGRLLPAGRLREPLRALERAQLVIVSRAPDPEAASAIIESVRPYAPSASFAAGHHALERVRTVAGGVAEAGGPAHVVTATGNPEAVVASARAAGFGPVTHSVYRDHHWFSRAEAERELRAAAPGCLLLTSKDAVRWPLRDGDVRVLDVAWVWTLGGETALSMLLEPEPV